MTTPPVAFTDAEEEKLIYDAVMAYYAKERKKRALHAASKAAKEATFRTEYEFAVSMPNGAKKAVRRRATNGSQPVSER
jgi:hypothetical protein